MRRSSAVVLALITTSSIASAGDWWTAKPAKRTGKISQHTRFTIDIPVAVEQDEAPLTDTFVAYNAAHDAVIATLRVSTMSKELQHAQTYEQYKPLLRDAKIYVEEPGKDRFAVLFRSDDGYVTGVIATAAGDDEQTLCTWTLPGTELKGKALPAWAAMKKACASIALGYK